jgi:hypothetical protein
MSTFADIDPRGVIPGALTVKHGVPSKNGERRTRIVDGPENVSISGVLWKTWEKSGEKARMRCEMKAETRANKIGSLGDEFVVSIRFAADKFAINTGYRRMHERRWDAFVLTDCSHIDVDPVELPPNAETGVGIDWTRAVPESAQVCIPLVHQNRHSRWMAVLGRTDGSRGIVLAGHNNCPKCAIINCVCQMDEKWALVY